MSGLFPPVRRLLIGCCPPEGWRALRSSNISRRGRAAAQARSPWRLPVKLARGAGPWSSSIAAARSIPRLLRPGGSICHACFSFSQRMMRRSCGPWIRRCAARESARSMPRVEHSTCAISAACNWRPKAAARWACSCVRLASTASRVGRKRSGRWDPSVGNALCGVPCAASGDFALNWSAVAALLADKLPN